VARFKIDVRPAGLPDDMGRTGTADHIAIAKEILLVLVAPLGCEAVAVSCTKVLTPAWKRQQTKLLR
jgi:hypothetical protein